MSKVISAPNKVHMCSKENGWCRVPHSPLVTPLTKNHGPSAMQSGVKNTVINKIWYMTNGYVKSLFSSCFWDITGKRPGSKNGKREEGLTVKYCW